MTFRELFSKLTSRYLWGNFLAMVIAVAIVLVGMYFFLDIYTNHGRIVKVPDVSGQPCEVAIRKLEAAGLRVEVSDTGYMPKLPGDIILEQHLVPGTIVKANRIVYLTVNSTSARRISLPDIPDNCSLREARMRLQALGFKLGPVRRVSGDLDWVYAVEVGGKQMMPGDRIPINQPLTLVVGDGGSEDVFNGNDSLDFLRFNEDSVVFEEVEVPLDLNHDNL